MSKLRSYQEFVKNTNEFNPKSLIRLMHGLTGLSAEVGEVQELFQKALRNSTKVDKADLTSELGDVLWYLTDVALANNIDLETIMNYNRLKITIRRNEANEETSS